MNIVRWLEVTVPPLVLLEWCLVVFPLAYYQAAEAEKFLEDSNEGEFEVAVCHRINHRVQG